MLILPHLKGLPAGNAGSNTFKSAALDLNFSTTKSLVDSISGNNLVTFTRASSGTCVDSAGVLRSAVTNLKTHSEAILSANGYGVNNATLATVSITNPFGDTTASLFTLNVGANTGNNTDGFHFGSGVALANSTAHAQSLFVKPAGATVLRLRSNVGGSVFDFTLTGNGTAPSLSADLQSASIIAFPNGWYRVSWTFTTTTSAPGNRGDYWTIKTNVADGTSGLYVVGAQLEAGAFPTSYIPTTSATATRAADVASITGTNFSSWYNQTEGTVLLDGRFNTVATNTALVSINDAANSSNNRHTLRIGNTIIVSGGTTVASFFQTPALQAIAKYAYGYAVNNFVQVLNSTSTSVDTLGAVPAGVNVMEIGKVEGTQIYSNGTIRRLTYWPVRLANNTLQAITQP